VDGDHLVCRTGSEVAGAAVIVKDVATMGSYVHALAAGNAAAGYFELQSVTAVVVMDLWGVAAMLSM
jgi:hypothetical protein